MHVLTMEDTTIINETLSAVNVNGTFTMSAISTKEDDPFWLIFMDRSQLVMTLIGVVANTATSITLIKNRQVT